MESEGHRCFRQMLLDNPRNTAQKRLHLARAILVLDLGDVFIDAKHREHVAFRSRLGNSYCDIFIDKRVIESLRIQARHRIANRTIFGDFDAML